MIENTVRKEIVSTVSDVNGVPSDTITNETLLGDKFAEIVGYLVGKKHLTITVIGSPSLTVGELLKNVRL